MFVGEIGISRHEFLYELRWWEVQAILRGYHRRARNLWSAIRWQTYNLMSVSMADLKKAGIYSPVDLIRFPWDDEARDGESNSHLPSDDEIKRMQEDMKRYNEEHATSSAE